MKKALYAAIVIGTLSPHFSEASWLTRITDAFRVSKTANFSRINIHKILNEMGDGILETRAKVIKDSKKKTLQEIRLDKNIQDIEIPDGTLNISVVSKRIGGIQAVRSYIYVTTDSRIPELIKWMDDNLARTLNAQLIDTGHVRRYEIDLSRLNKDRVRFTMNIFLQGIKKSDSATIKSRKNI